MSRHFHSGLVGASALLFTAPSASAAVSVSTAATQNMLCAAGVCSPTAADAVLNAGDLESLLASGNVEVTTTGSGVQADDIRIDALESWPSASVLTLDAYKSVTIDKLMKVSGAGGVSVITNDGGSGGEFSFGNRGSLNFQNLSSPLTINGIGYTLVGSVATLSSAIAANPSGAFALANVYDASQDGTYTTSPVSTVFTGAFNGLGNAISNLTIDDPTENAYVGLFAEISGSATLADLRLTNLNVTGGSGSSDSTSTEFVGGLAGYADGGTINNVVATGTVIAGQYAAVGGLVGVGDGVIESLAANVSVSNGLLGDAGGLVGAASGAVSHSHATGDVSGSGFVGGLVGFNYLQTIEHSSATGVVTGVDTYTYAGGLVGINEGKIAKSSASGAVNCEFTCGELAGINGDSPDGIDTISESYATGNISGGVAGGLAGFNQASSIIDSYAIGSASGAAAGGLVGDNAAGEGEILLKRSYSSGAVTATEYAGGLIGYDQFSGSINKAYWDTTTSGITNLGQGSGNISYDPGIKGQSNTKLQAGLPRGFNPGVWTENAAINGGLPYLVANPPAK